MSYYEKTVKNNTYHTLKVTLLVRPHLGEGASNKLISTGELRPGQEAVVPLAVRDKDDMPYLNGFEIEASDGRRVRFYVGERSSDLDHAVNANDSFRINIVNFETAWLRLTPWSKRDDKMWEDVGVAGVRLTTGLIGMPSVAEHDGAGLFAYVHSNFVCLATRDAEGRFSEAERMPQWFTDSGVALAVYAGAPYIAYRGVGARLYGAARRNGRWSDDEKIDADEVLYPSLLAHGGSLYLTYLKKTGTGYRAGVRKKTGATGAWTDFASVPYAVEHPPTLIAWKDCIYLIFCDVGRGNLICHAWVNPDGTLAANTAYGSSSSSSGISMAVHDGQLFAAYVNPVSRIACTHTVGKPLDLDRVFKEPLEWTTGCMPQLAVYGGKLHMFYKGPGERINEVVCTGLNEAQPTGNWTAADFALPPPPRDVEPQMGREDAQEQATKQKEVTGRDFYWEG